MPNKEELKQELQKKYLELQFLDQQINQIRQNIMLLENQSIEMQNLIDNIGEIKNTKKSSKTFSPVGAGFYIESEIKDTSNLLVNVGSNIMIKKSTEEAKTMVAQQEEELKKVSEALKGDMHQYMERFQELQESLTEISKSLSEDSK